MRVLQISANCNVGSVGRIMERIGSAAIDRGMESYVAYGRNYRPSSSNVIKIGGKLNVYTHALKARIFDSDGLGSKCATSNLLRHVESINPDIIHIHCLHGYYLNYPLLFDYIKEKEKPLVWTFHDCWSFTGHCCFPSYRNCDRYKKDCSNCSCKKDYPSSYLLSRSRENLEQKKACFLGINNLRVVTVSNWLKGIVEESFFSSNKIDTIYNGVNLEIFKPYEETEEYEIRKKYSIHPQNDYIIGVAFPWSERKGLADFINLRKVLEDKVQIVLVGLNSKQIEQLPRGIIGIPRISEPCELAQLYSSASIVMNLSSAETFGMTTAEGFACGTPCIGYNCTATPELITKDTGFVVKAGDIEGLNIAVKTILKEGKSHYSYPCRERAESVFDEKKCFDQYIDLYCEML